MTDQAAVYCWGQNYAGQLGDGTTTFRSQTAPANPTLGYGAAFVAGGDSHACASSGAETTCWGANTTGQLGFGATAALTLVPGTAVAGLIQVAALVGGSSHSCALLASGAVSCWGDDTYGQLGDGRVMSSTAPLAVLLP